MAVKLKSTKESFEPINLTNKTFLQYLMLAIPGCFTTFILSVVDYLSVATVYFPNNFSQYEETKYIPENEDILTFNYHAISRMLFILSSVLSMGVYNIVTKINWGGFAGSIIENMKFTQYIVVIIVSEVYKKHKDMKNIKIYGVDEMVVIVIVNTIVCFMLGSLIFAIFSFIFYTSGLSIYLEYVPTPIICGFMGGIAWGQFKTFLDSIQIEKASNNMSSFNLLGREIQTQMLIFGVIIGLTIYLLSKIFPKFSLTIIFTIILGTILTYGIAYFKYRAAYLDDLRKLKYIKEGGEDTFFNVFSFFKLIFHIKYIDLNIIWKCKFSILNIGIFSMLHLPINYSIYRNFVSSYINDETVVKKHASTLSIEMKTQMIINFIGSFTSFIPSYMLGGYSVALFRAGGRSKIIGIIGALCNATLPYIGPKIYSYIPVFVVGAVPLFLSFCFSYDFIIDFYNKIISLIFKQTRLQKSKNNLIDYNQLKENDFVLFSQLPSHLRNSDFFDFIISCIVLILFIRLDDYTIISLFVGFFCCFLKQCICYLFRFYKTIKSGNIFYRNFGCNFIQKADYKGITYSVYKPITMNFWNFSIFDAETYPIIFDMREIEYIDIFAVNRLSDNDLIIY